MNRKKTQVISIVGAGGKTSLLYTLAEMFLRGDGDLRLFGLEPVKKDADIAACEAEDCGPETGGSEAGTPGRPRILVTASTKILVPEHCGWCADAAAVRKEWEAGRYAAAGTLTEEWPGKASEGLPVKKLKALPEKEFQELLAEADVVLIEADGAKHLPLKLPAAHEPVIRPETTLVLGVAGLSALGRPLGEVCFRAELIAAVPAFRPVTAELITAVPAFRPVTAELIAAILASEQGTRKNVGDRPYLAVLNQCTTPEREAAGREILKLLEEKYQVNGVLTALSAPAGNKDRETKTGKQRPGTKDWIQERE